MTDVPATPKPISRDIQTGVGLSMLFLEIIGYVLLTVFGDQTNTMHTSAQTGLFWGAHVVLLGLGVINVLPEMLKR